MLLALSVLHEVKVRLPTCSVHMESDVFLVWKQIQVKQLEIYDF